MSRIEALNIHESFIIQAPAGSGKTELLIQRYLSLLAQAVQVPEEILCITFTRKAAAEMRERILQSLLAAKNGTPPQPHQTMTRMLSQQVLQKNEAHQWSLLENPHRMRISTFDAFASHLCKRTPFLTKFSPEFRVTENAEPYYRTAIQQLFLHTQSAHTEKPFGIILQHLENRIDYLESLLLHLLYKRDQWLPHIVPFHHHPEILKPLLEAGLKRITQDALAAIQAAFPKEYQRESFTLLCFAEENRSGQKTFSAFEENNPLLWKALAQLFLTDKGTLRKRIDKNLGFPVEAREAKKHIMKLLEELSRHAYSEAIEQALENIRTLPPVFYTETQWSLLSALIQLLPILVAELQLVFHQHQSVDFIELNLRALDALGTFEEFSELALQLEYQIQHILVDEFQDTSTLQFSLLQRLTQHWAPENGHTLFLVGDPMQSIYRFRNAEVGLFLRAQQQGLHPIVLKSIRLEENFRSQASLIDWFNSTFQQIFPKMSDIVSGRVPYSPAQAVRPVSTTTAVTYYAATNTTLVAQEVLRTIRHIQEQFPLQRIAILVRTRTQLGEILNVLHEHQVPYQAVDIYSLSEEPSIQDLLALTRALLYLNDRIAWLAVLRAPWCGLTWADLLLIANAEPETVPIFYTLSLFESQPERLANLSDAGKKYLQRVVPILMRAVEMVASTEFEFLLKSAWIHLGGPRCLKTESELENIECFFKLIRTLEAEGTSFSVERVYEKLEKLFAGSNPEADGLLQIMTIHKAKGLEFEHVLLPGLEATTRAHAAELFSWMERPRSEDQSDLILAPIKHSFDEENTIYDYVKKVENEKLEQEIARLFYVAATRAREHLYLFSTLTLNEENQPKKPAKNSFLSLLPLEPFLENLECDGKDTEIDSVRNDPLYYRLDADAPLPFEIKKITEERNAPVILWNAFSTVTQRALGTVFHETVQQAERFVLLEATLSFTGLTSFWKQRLSQLYLSEAEIKNAVPVLEIALKNMLNDEKGRWILKPHADAHNEFTLTGVLNNKIISIVIDRTFVDENNFRWIIDYKTSAPAENETVEEFFAKEKLQYWDTLQQYALLMHAYDPLHEIRVALYFPRISELMVLNTNEYTN